MFKKLLAILASLAMVLSLAACGSYEITIEKKDDEKVASDSIDEKEEIEEDEDEPADEPEEDEEEETEEEPEEDKDDSEDEEFLATPKEIRDYLSKALKLNDYENSNETDSSISYSMSYDENDRSKFDFTLKIDGEKLQFPTTYDDLKEKGYSFSSSMHNEKSEQPASTTGNYYFNAPGGGIAWIMSLNSSDYDKPIIDCDFYGVTLYGYEFDNSASKKIVRSSRASDFVINGTIDADSSAIDVINEFGMPNKIYVGFSKYFTWIQLTYTEKLGSGGYSTEELTFNFKYYDGGTYLEDVSYKYPYSKI